MSEIEKKDIGDALTEQNGSNEVDANAEIANGDKQTANVKKAKPNNKKKKPSSK